MAPGVEADGPTAERTGDQTPIQLDGHSRGGLAIQPYRRKDYARKLSIHFVQPHYHALGTGMRIETYRRGGGSALIYQTNRLIGEPMGATLAPAAPLTGADGIRVTCSYTNPGTEAVGFAASEQGEMCVLFGLTDSPHRWIGGVLPESDTMPIHSTTDSAIQAFSGDCQVFALE